MNGFLEKKNILFYVQIVNLLIGINQQGRRNNFFESNNSRLCYNVVPKKYLRISRPLKVIIFIAVYFIILIISGLNAPKIEQQYGNYILGETFNITYNGNIFSMKVVNISKETQMTINGGQNLSTSGYYIFVNGYVTNLGKTPSGLQFKSELRDGADNLYTLFAMENRVGEFQPNLEKRFYNVFEIPKQASELKFYVKDKTSVIKVISLE